MTFKTLDLLIKQCEEHLDKTNTRSTEIETHLVQYLLVRICAEYEIRVKALINRRCARVGDSHIQAFSQKTVDYVCRHFDISHIASVLDRFGGNYRRDFHARVMSGTAHVSWNNIYTNRQAVAHKIGPQMSFGDLKTDYNNSLLVLDSLVVALTLNANEIQDLI